MAKKKRKVSGQRSEMAYLAYLLWGIMGCADGVTKQPTKELCRVLDVNPRTIYGWKTKYQWMKTARRRTSHTFWGLFSTRYGEDGELGHHAAHTVLGDFAPAMQQITREMIWEGGLPPNLSKGTSPIPGPIPESFLSQGRIAPDPGGSPGDVEGTSPVAEIGRLQDLEDSRLALAAQKHDETREAALGSRVDALGESERIRAFLWKVVRRGEKLLDAENYIPNFTEIGKAIAELRNLAAMDRLDMAVVENASAQDAGRSSMLSSLEPVIVTMAKAKGLSQISAMLEHVEDMRVILAQLECQEQIENGGIIIDIQAVPEVVD